MANTSGKARVHGLDQPIEEFASASWRLLKQRLASTAESADARIELPCTLKVRESTGFARPIDRHVI